MVEMGVPAWGFSPGMVLPVNENDPTGGDVTNKPCAFRDVLFRDNEAGSLGLGGVSARDFSLAEAIPVNENVPRGDDVLALLVVREISTRELTPEGALPVNENVPWGDDVFPLLVVGALGFSPGANENDPVRGEVSMGVKVSGLASAGRAPRYFIYFS